MTKINKKRPGLAQFKKNVKMTHDWYDSKSLHHKTVDSEFH